MSECQSVAILKSEFAKRRQAHANYSLRAFAKRASISPGLLSDIFNGRRNLTASMAHRIARRIEMPPDLLREFLKTTLTLKDKKAKKAPEPKAYVELSADQLQVMADWYSYALLSLLKIYPELSIRSAAQKLGVPYFDVKDAIERLQRLQLLTKGPNGRWVCANNLSTTHDIPNETIRAFHYQYLQQAMHRLDTQHVKRCEYSTMTMAINRKHIPEAKMLIRRFRRELCELLEQGTPEETYALTIQLFSLEQ